MSNYEVSELLQWDERIREKAAEFGLDWFPQEFEICDHNGMLGYMAYSGMPSHYPHWSFGKSYEKLKTLYDYGVSGLPYEMVINSNPALAYLMRDNTLLLHILTIAHVYGHNDFFKNNFTFKSTRADFTIETFKAHAMRVRRYIEDPSIGITKVEPVLDAAHALSWQCRRNLAIKTLTPEEQIERAEETARPREDPFRRIHRRPEYKEPEVRKVPLEPDEDLLLFIRDHNPFLEEWEKDLLTIVDEETKYFLPMMETKIMNEGWASYWHKKIVESLGLEQGLRLEFIIRHNQVLRPVPGQINPYHLGFKVWENLFHRYEVGRGAIGCDIKGHDHDYKSPERKAMKPPYLGEKSGSEMLFTTREVERDRSFLRRYLTEELMREMDMFEYEAKGDNLVVSKVSDEEGWKAVKEMLLKNVGTGSIPVIKVEDADFGGKRTLYLKHYHDGRDLLREYAEKTLSFAYQLWGREREVVLETLLAGKKSLLVYNEKGPAMRDLK